MPYTSAIFLVDLPTMSDHRDQLARKLFKSTIHPTSSLHNLLPPPCIHLSLHYESPQNFLASPLEPKNTNHSSHMLSPTIRLHNCFFQCIYCFFVFVCVFLLVQPLAITFNKQQRSKLCNIAVPTVHYSLPSTIDYCNTLVIFRHPLKIASLQLAFSIA